MRWAMRVAFGSSFIWSSHTDLLPQVGHDAATGTTHEHSSHTIASRSAIAGVIGPGGPLRSNSRTAEMVSDMMSVPPGATALDADLSRTARIRVMHASCLGEAEGRRRADQPRPAARLATLLLPG